MGSNLWRRFAELVQAPAEEVATVVAVGSNSTITATTLTGGVVRLRCAIDVSVGDKVFAGGGDVRAKAPDLDYYELEV